MTVVRFVLRLPPALHDRLVEQATAQGVSLNTWIISLLAAASAKPNPFAEEH